MHASYLAEEEYRVAIQSAKLRRNVYFNVKYFGYVPKSHAEEHLSDTLFYSAKPLAPTPALGGVARFCQHAEEMHTERMPGNATACLCYAENPRIHPCEQVLASSSVMLSQTSHNTAD